MQLNYYLGEKAKISTDNIFKTEKLTAKQPGWINDNTGKKENVFLILGSTVPLMQHNVFGVVFVSHSFDFIIEKLKLTLGSSVLSLRQMARHI